MNWKMSKKHSRTSFFTGIQRDRGQAHGKHIIKISRYYRCQNHVQHPAYWASESLQAVKNQ